MKKPDHSETPANAVACSAFVRRSPRRISAQFPTEFRGCFFDDGWEFDAPGVIYYPPKYARFGDGGNTGVIDQMVEDICFDLAEGDPHNDGGLDQECSWRGWGRNGFAKRRRARHVRICVEWEHDGEHWNATPVSREEQMGPFFKTNVRDDQQEEKR